MLSVTSAQDKEKLITTNGPATCTNNILQNVKTPRAYFCINENNGGIYTTDGFTAHAPSDGDYIIKVEATVSNFPPTIKTTDITVSTKSICRTTTKLFRKLIDANCPSYSNFLSLKSLNSDQQQNGQSTYNIEMESEMQQYYFAGIRFKTSLSSQRLPLNQLGNHITFTLIQQTTNGGGGQSIIAKYFYVGAYISFTAPLLFKKSNNDKYTISASSYQNETGQDETVDYPFDLSNIEISVIEQKDYCSERTDCTDLYQVYQTEFMATKSATEQHCEDPNSPGYKIMYGYCQGMCSKGALLACCARRAASHSVS